MNQSGSYLIYLRKSRSDAEAEQRGEGETLARHEHMLLELAGKLRLHVADVYREVVSGETIAARPMMQRLLSEVGQGLWAGVLVVEVERLARGDTVDQGIVARTFQLTGTKIITPAKTYDPDNEFDEEYFEFGLFMSRREYKTINRRLQRGRLNSLKEGKYPHSVPPFGYNRKKLEHGKGFTLEPKPEEADVVRMMFELYTAGELREDGTRSRCGLHKIAARLNAMGIRTKRGKLWTESGVRDVIRNPVYIGKLWWCKRRAEKRMENGAVKVRYVRDYSNAEYYDGIHEPIIDRETYDLAQTLMDTTPAIPVRTGRETQNPLCGLVVCGKCGGKMQYRKHFKKGARPGIVCAHSSCDNVGADLTTVESRVVDALRDWLKNYSVSWDCSDRQANAEADVRRAAVKRISAEIASLRLQQDSLHDLLERGVYDADTFLSRSRIIGDRLNRASADLGEAQRGLSETEARGQSRAQGVPTAAKLPDVYAALPSPAAKNAMLREVIDKIVYVKDVENRRVREDAFAVDLYPRLPKAAPEH